MGSTRIFSPPRRPPTVGERKASGYPRRRVPIGPFILQLRNGFSVFTVRKKKKTILITENQTQAHKPPASCRHSRFQQSASASLANRQAAPVCEAHGLNRWHGMQPTGTTQSEKAAASLAFRFLHHRTPVARSASLSEMALWALTVIVSGDKRFQRLKPRFSSSRFGDLGSASIEARLAASAFTLLR
jgi:hypothetical protein